MKLNSSFWKGFVIGAVLAGMGGLAFANLAVKFYWVGPALSHNSGVYAKVQAAAEAGQTEQAVRTLRDIAWGERMNARYANCMSEHWNFFWLSRANERCSVHFKPAFPPDDWEIREIEEWRQRMTESRN